MAGEATCPQCGAMLEADAPQGLCPSCLLVVAIGDAGQNSASDRFFSPTTPGQLRFVPPPVQSLAEFFPQLELIELLGYGGMGAVYKARQIKLDRHVALKIVRSDAAADPAFAERFNREARTLARLSHPNVVAVHDFGEITTVESGAAVPPLFYFVMEFVDGTNLRQLMNGDRLQPGQAMSIIPQICEALQYAHDEGVVHRDIKPENILIDKRGRVKIADFGLAKLAAGSSDDFTLTGTHQVMGTPRYMAPEQMEGSHSVDHRADIYSLGVVFYEMLTGQVPAGHFEPPSKKADVDARLDFIVLKAMAREPERRFQQASQVRMEVESVRMTPQMRSNGGYASQAADPLIPPRPAPQSVSEFLSYEAAAAAGWFAGTPGKGTGVPVTIRWLAPLLCLVALVTLFQSWLTVYITDRDATVRADRTMVEPYTNITAVLKEFTPLEHPIGAIAGMSIVILLLLQLVATGAEPPKRWPGILRILVAVYALAMLLVFRSATDSTLIRVYHDPETGASPRHFVDLDGITGGDAWLGELEHKTLFTPSAITGFASLLAVLVINAVSLRYAPRNEPRPAASTQAVNRILTASRLLIAIGILQLLSVVILMFVPMVLYKSSRGDDPATRWSIIASMLLIIPLVLNVLVGVSSLVASPFVARKRWYRCAVTICVLSVLPLSATWPFTMPLAIWCLGILLRDETRLQFPAAGQQAAGQQAAGQSVSDFSERARTILQRTGFPLNWSSTATAVLAVIALIVLLVMLV